MNVTRYWVLGVEEVQGRDYLRILCANDDGDKARTVAELIGKTGSFKQVALVRVEEVW